MIYLFIYLPVPVYLFRDIPLLTCLFIDLPVPVYLFIILIYFEPA